MSLLSPLDTAPDTKAKQQIKTHGKPIVYECLGKYCWQEVSFPDGFLCQEENCNHTLSEWLTGAERWEDRFELRGTADMGFGLHSKQEWNKDDVLGAYLGELIPKRNSNPDYCHEVFIGPEFTKTKATIAYIDAEHCGNYTRFCNHSCEHNAVIAERRVGKERVLALTAVRSIAAGEQVTIDYGEEYFWFRKCLCGLRKCRYPNEVNLRDSTKRAKSGDSEASSWLLEEDRTTRYDSVLDPDNETDMI